MCRAAPATGYTGSVNYLTPGWLQCWSPLSRSELREAASGRRRSLQAVTREERREREEEVRRGSRREREGEEEGGRESSLVARPSRESTGITLEVEVSLEMIISTSM